MEENSQSNINTPFQPSKDIEPLKKKNSNKIIIVIVIVGFIIAAPVAVYFVYSWYINEKNITPIGHDESSEITETAETGLPEQLPKDFPIYPNAEIAETSTSNGIISIAWGSNDKLEDVYGLYESELKDTSWTITQSNLSAEGGIIELENQDFKGMISIGTEMNEDINAEVLILVILNPTLAGNMVDFEDQLLNTDLPENYFPAGIPNYANAKLTAFSNNSKNASWTTEDDFETVAYYYYDQLKDSDWIVTDPRSETKKESGTIAEYNIINETYQGTIAIRKDNFTSINIRMNARPDLNENEKALINSFPVYPGGKLVNHTFTEAIESIQDYGDYKYSSPPLILIKWYAPDTFSKVKEYYKNALAKSDWSIIYEDDLYINSEHVDYIIETDTYEGTLRVQFSHEHGYNVELELNEKSDEWYSVADMYRELADSK